MTSMKRLFSIPLPRVLSTDKEWRSAVVEDLKPYFITPKADAASFLRQLDEELGIRELKNEDLDDPCLRHDVETIRKGAGDSFWLVSRSEGSRIFFEYEYRTGNFTSEQYDDGNILIGYHPYTDSFYSSSGFLESVMGWLRGIDDEDLGRDSPEMYPIRTALSYAANLEAALSMYSCWRGIDFIRRVLHAKALAITVPHGKIAELSRPAFMPLFRMLFSSDISFSTQNQQTKEGDRYRLEFLEKDGSSFVLRFETDRLYYGQREYYCLGEAAPLLSCWLNGIAKAQG